MIRNYQETLDYLYSLVDFEARADANQAALFNLRRIELLLEKLGDPHLAARSVHIAGTKGKGSTAAMISSVLSFAGFKTGLYISPHLIDFVERVSINGQYIPEQEVIDLAAELEPLVHQINSRAEYGRLTTFEVVTVIAFVYFARSGAEFQVMETGMGGRLDATNVINPLVSVITLIGLDHTAVLGDTLALIAAEKAGIIKNHGTVISARQSAPARDVIRKVASEREAKLVEIESSIECSRVGYEGRFQLFELSSPRDKYSIKLPLLGAYQKENLCCAVMALEEISDKGINISKATIEQGMQTVKWPGRFDLISSNPLVIVDGAHNPESMHALMEALEGYLDSYNQKIAKKTLIIGASSDKDISSMAALLEGVFDKVIVTRANHPRSMEVEKIAKAFKDSNMETSCTNSVGEALRNTFQHLAQDDLLLITGSLFVAGEAIASLRAREAA
jgi:dihydrofolate synthase/folylpolyglutamate synthase